MPDGSRSRRLLIIETSLVVVALLASAWRQHAAGGVDLELLAFAALLAGPALRRLLALVADVEPAPTAVFVLELLSLGALVETRVAAWGVLPASLAALLGACPAMPSTPRRASLLERAALLAMAIAASLAVARGWNAEHRAGAWSAVPLGVLLGSAALSARGAFAGDPSRHASGVALVLASALIHRHWGFAAFEIEAVTLLGAWAAAAWAALDVVGRFVARGDHARLVGFRRRLTFASIACSVPLLALGALGEVAIRRIPRDRDLHGAPLVDDGRSFHVPNARYVFAGDVLANPEPRDLVRNEFVWNAEGFHDRDHELAKPATTVRVAFLGDSFVDAYQLHLEDLVHVGLERGLARATPAPLRAEVLAFATAGWCQRQELATLRDRALRYAPDLVVLEFLPSNDVYENSPDLASALRASQSTLGHFLSGVARNRGLLFAGLVTERLERTIQRASGSNADALISGVWRADLPPEQAAPWEAAWTVTEELVRSIADATEASGARLAVVVFANEAEVSDHVARAGHRGFDFEAPARRMKAICERRAIPCLELASRFAKRDAATRAQLFLLGDGHWSSVGHRAAAEELTSFLTTETGIWPELVARANRRGH